MLSRTVLLIILLALAHSTSASASPAQRVLFLMRANPPGGSADPSVKTHLETMGYTVTVHDGLTDIPDLCGFDLVVLSSTVQSAAFTSNRDAIVKLRDTGMPLVTWENDLLDDLRFTGMRRDVDFGDLEQGGHYIWVVRAPHPLAAGVPAGMSTWTEGREPVGWGTPGLGADIIMTLPGFGDKSTLFAYERGATMDYDFLAPARRVFIGLENGTFDKLNDNGRKLFDAAIRWAGEGPKACLSRK